MNFDILSHPSLLWPNWDIVGEYFVVILHYLRTGHLNVPSNWSRTQKYCLFREAEFYCLDLPVKFTTQWKLLLEDPKKKNAADSWFEKFKQVLWNHISGCAKRGLARIELSGSLLAQTLKIQNQPEASLHHHHLNELGTRIRQEWGLNVTVNSGIMTIKWPSWGKLEADMPVF